MPQHQPASRVLMIQPTRFGFNPETAANNPFMHDVVSGASGQGVSPSATPPPPNVDVLQSVALSEFDNVVSILRACGVSVEVFSDLPESTTPDSIFPNNWFSTHVVDGGAREIILYPMHAASRRRERRDDIIQVLMDRCGYKRALPDLVLSESAQPPQYLEGTGSIVFDHDARIAYASRSERTSEELVQKVAAHLGYTPFVFDAVAFDGKPLYHTNVMLAVGKTFVACGIDAVAPADQDRLRAQIGSTGKELIVLAADQVFYGFAGNMLQLRNAQGESVLVMSASALDCLTEEQREALLVKHNTHVAAIEIPTIQKVGGGSVRCMIAELY